MYARFGGLALLVAALLGSSPVLAEDEFNRKGWYAGAGGLFAIEKFNQGAEGKYGGGFDLTLGYRVTEIISLETEFEWVGHWYQDLEDEPESRINMYTWTANVKGSVPLGRYQPYGALGFGFYRARFERGLFSIPPNDDNVGAAMKVMIGVDFYVTKHIVLAPEFEYSFLFDGTSSLDYMGIGGKIAYRF